MQILNAGHRLARPAVGDDAGEPLGARMKRKKLTARPVGDGDLGALRLGVFHDGCLGSPMRREMRTLYARNSHLTAASKHCRRESIRPRARQLVILEYDLLCIICVT